MRRGDTGVERRKLRGLNEAEGINQTVAVIDDLRSEIINMMVDSVLIVGANVFRLTR